MKLTMTKVLTPIAALAFSFGVQAAAVSTETFDTYTAGTTVITNQTGWSFTYGTDGADDASAITAYGESATPTSVPEGMTYGSNYLKLSTEDGILLRNIDGDSGADVLLNAGLFVDTDVQFTITDASDRPTPTADDKFIIWLEDQGTATNLCAYALNLADGVVTSNAYTLVDASGNSLGIEPGSWHRLTVKAISDANAGGNSALPGFQVYLDGVVVKTSAIVATGTSYSGLSSSAQTLIAGQTFLPAMASSMTTLKQVGFSGEGAIDCVAVTKDIPEFLPRQKITISWDTTVLNSVTLLDANNAEVTTLTTSGSSVIVDSATALHFGKAQLGFVNPGAATSYDLTDPAIDTESWNVVGSILALNDGVVTIAAGNVAAGSFSVALEANTACVLTLEAGEGVVDAIASVSYQIGSGAAQSISDIGELEFGVEVQCSMGDVITFTVTPKTGYTCALSDASGGTLSGSMFTVGNNATAGLSITFEAAGATVTPGNTDGGSYASAAEAATAAGNVTIDASAAVKAALNDDATAIAAYVAKFETKVIDNGNGTYSVAVDLTAEAAEDLQDQADADVATIAAGITGTGDISITATPGFYYSLKEGTTLTNMTEGTRVLATGNTVSLTPTKSGTAGFYKVVINIAPAATATEPEVGAGE